MITITGTFLPTIFNPSIGLSILIIPILIIQLIASQVYCSVLLMKDLRKNGNTEWIWLSMIPPFNIYNMEKTGIWSMGVTSIFALLYFAMPFFIILMSDLQHSGLFIFVIAFIWLAMNAWMVWDVFNHFQILNRKFFKVLLIVNCILIVLGLASEGFLF